MVRKVHIRRPAVTSDAATTPAGEQAPIDMYLTDGVFLYRVVDVIWTESGEMADLEDCYGLDIVRIPMSDLRARQLRVVAPA
jgi:hypothetical protein